MHSKKKGVINMSYIDFSDLPDLQEDRTKTLDLTYIIMKQLDTIRVIASREFHKGLILYTDSGAVKNYLPNVLESYKKAINNLVDLIRTMIVIKED